MDAEVWITSLQDINVTNPDDNGLRYLLRTDYKGEVLIDVTYLNNFNYLGPFHIDIIHPDYYQSYFNWDASFSLDETFMLWPKPLN